MAETYARAVGLHGTAEELGSLVNLSRRANEAAASVYGPAFDEIVAREPGRLAELDLAVATTGRRLVPVLRSGFNDYEALAATPLEFKRGVDERVRVDALLVVPEVNRVLGARVQAMGLPSILRDVAAARRLKVIDGLAAVPLLADRVDAVRAFDSHLGVVTYWRLVQLLLFRLGLTEFRAELEFVPHEYRCDLGSRFLSAATTGVFGSERHLVLDEAYDVGRNRGTVRRYENAAAPVDARILVMGDSHTYSMMGQMLSFVFREVHFYWMGRLTADSPHWSAVEELARSCDFVVEETAERFFLANFARPRSPVGG